MRGATLHTDTHTNTHTHTQRPTHTQPAYLERLLTPGMPFPLRLPHCPYQRTWTARRLPPTFTPQSAALHTVPVGAKLRESPADSCSMGGVPELELAAGAVLKPSETLQGGVPVRGYDFNNGVDYDALFESLRTTGFQATSFAKATDTIRAMLHWRGKKGRPVKLRRNVRYFLGNRMVDVLVATAGGVEEDLIKCLRPHVMGEFNLDGRDLRRRGLNRIGNLIVPNDNYCRFEEWIMPILVRLVSEQEGGAPILTPSSLLRRLGQEINDENSILYWCYKNDIPVFSPALTDGSLGDMLYMNSYKHETGLILDIVKDIRLLNDIAIHADCTGVIILGAGLVKHHILNANLFRNGADFSVFVNTAVSFDGSDSGADPDESLSWGKLKPESTPVKVFGDASFVFPLLVSQTFAKLQRERS
ncbi:unnamed protein product (mitochondrion) [Plasmodiophora brassicae]|uniref:Deoxyhypusine synthase n=1 Tax=Plasmodiophora brassicae TaxID=37360 RepID=A0A3P3Y5X6_PLABS|nr:unnamed protein product [Plasmodiophora brassicae]